MNRTKAIILAAGRGRRMGALSSDRPKCLLEFRGKALLDWQIESIRQAGITEIGIVSGYKRELLVDRHLVEFHNNRWATTNMVESLASASAWLEDGACIVSYSDIFYSPDAVRSLIWDDSLLGITYDPSWARKWSLRFDEPLLDAETFRLDSESNIVEIGGRPTSIEEIEGQYMGLLRFSPDGWAEVKAVRSELRKQEAEAIHMTATLQKVIDRGIINVSAIPYFGEWGEFDSEQDFLTQR